MTADGRPQTSPDRRPFDSVRNPPDAAAIEEWLSLYVADLLRVKPETIDVRRPFAYFGLNSADGVILAGDLEKWLGAGRLSPTLAWDFPTIEAMARHLAQGNNSAQPESRVATPARCGDMEQILGEIERLPDSDERDSSDRKPSDFGNSVE